MFFAGLLALFVLAFALDRPAYAAGEVPVISGPPIVIGVGGSYDPLEGITITDDKDSEADLMKYLDYKDSTDVSRIDVYEIYYFLEDSDGNPAELVRPVFVLGPDQPLIYAPFTVLELDQPYDPLENVYAFDLIDGDLTDSIEIISDNVDTSKQDKYEIIFQVTDKDGFTDEGTKSVTVRVPASAYPTIQVPSLTVYLPLNAEFDPLAGVSATDAIDGNLTDQIEVKSHLDTSVAGKYVIGYTVTNSKGITGGETVQIYVLASSNPELKARDFTMGLNEELPSIWKSGDLEAYDLEDGDLTDEISVNLDEVDNTKPGTYPIYLQVSDSDNNTIYATCYVTVMDFSYPELEVWDQTVIIGSKYDPLAEARAYDRQDGNLTDEIKILENTMDTSKLGTYSVTYSVTDSDKNTTTKTVEVKVIKEPVYSYYLNYEGTLILLEMDEKERVIKLTSPVFIPADSKVSLAIFIDDEPFFEFPGFTIGGDIQPDLPYTLESTGKDILMPIIMPHLYNSIGRRTTAISGEVQFMSTTGGTLYYDVSNVGSELPEIDTSGKGVPCNPGVNILKLVKLPPAKAQIVRIVMVDPKKGPSNALTIQLLKTPGQENKEQNKPEKPKDTKDPKLPGGRNLTMEKLLGINLD